MLIYIVGYGRSASTILSQILEKKLNAVNLGEIKFLYRNDFDDLLDSYWLKFKNKNMDFINLNSDKLKRFDNVFGFLKLHKKREYRSIWNKLFEKIGVNPARHIIIDNSKTTFNSFMRGFQLHAAFDEVYFLYPNRKYTDVVRSKFKGSNGNLERGEKRNFLLRIIHTALIAVPHITLTRLLSQLYHFKGMHIINLDSMEEDVDAFIQKNCIKPSASSPSLPMIYGNRNRKEK